MHMLPARRRVRLAAVWLTLAAAGPLVAAGQGAAGAAAGRPLVVAAEIDALIHPVSAEFIAQTIRRADDDGAALVVLVLRTPGGLVDSTRDINTSIIEAETPVVVYVGPSGTRAASAGFLITIAADVAAMAPGTHIGAAHPVSGTGQAMDETAAEKAASDVAAYARSLAASASATSSWPRRPSPTASPSPSAKRSRRTRRSSIWWRPTSTRCSNSSMGGR